MDYFKFNDEYMKIYKERFRELENTGYSWAYLENEIYALRKVGESEFIIVTARSPQKAYDKVKKLIIIQNANNIINIKNIERLD